MIPKCAILDNGSLNLSYDEDPAAIFANGILVNSDGAIRISEDLPETFLAGLGLRATGELCVEVGGTIATYNQGLPITASGLLVVQEESGSTDGVFNNRIHSDILGVFVTGLTTSVITDSLGDPILDENGDPILEN